MTHVGAAQPPDSQAMEERYRRAEALIQGFGTKSLVQNETIYPHWIIDASNTSTYCFWYERGTRVDNRSGKEYRLVDAKKRTNTLAFDHELLSHALAKASNQEVNAQDLPISHVTITLTPVIVSFTAFDQRWQFLAEEGICQLLQSTLINDSEVLSPDGRQIAFVRDYNLWVRVAATGTERALTLDGEEDFAYAVKGGGWGADSSGLHGHPALWSPDSRCLLTVKRDKRQVHSLPQVTHLPMDGSARPQLTQSKVAYSGDTAIETYQILNINVDTSQACYADYHPLPAGRNEYWGYAKSKLSFWAKGNQYAYFIAQERGDKVLRLVKFDTYTGSTQVLFEETSETQIDIMPDTMNLPLHQILVDSNELIWCSERSGWAHLYLYDLTTGALKHAITQGNWRVRDLLRVDAKNRTLYLQTAGRATERDPYYRDICRVNIDTGEIITVLSSDHEYLVNYPESITSITASMLGVMTREASGLSPDGQYIVVTQTRADQAPTNLLINYQGQTILEVESADLSALPDNWQWPEPVKLLAADGKTDIYGLLFRPSDFSPDKSYPVINFINSGTWLSAVPKGSFHTSRGYADRHYFYSAAMAELGFIVLNLDSRGSPLRSKAFLDESYGWIPAAANTDDHAGAIQQLTQRYPYMDINRVGICGQGYRCGLQNFLERQDLYKVCAQMALLDNRLIGCTVEGDKWEGINGPDSNTHRYPEELVSQLKGKLILMHAITSEMSAGYPSTAVFRVVEALQKANKAFEMLMVPGSPSDSFCSSYMTRRGWDFLVKHLLEITPPKEFSLNDASI
ncbi:Prolyl tripeptidyl peptidase precursor [Gammaproteobacteria bacterium MOLA455]|nr:Prolyl tripeptidyl peptidase precursor [Gammaproteobacteria bacterium MOLA455]